MQSGNDKNLSSTAQIWDKVFGAMAGSPTSEAFHRT